MTDSIGGVFVASCCRCSKISSIERYRPYLISTYDNVYTLLWIEHVALILHPPSHQVTRHGGVYGYFCLSSHEYVTFINLDQCVT